MPFLSPRRSRLVLSLACALVATAAVPTSAGARVIDAVSVLPPGNSGFVPQSGDNPHLTDQLGLYTSFSFKSAAFNRPGSTETPRAGVTIVRDQYDVPAITGVTQNDAWWGAGYAAAQDRLVEMELFRRGVTGRLAEVLGKDRLASDIVARRDYYTRAELARMYAKLPASLRGWFESYADGINAYLAKVDADPSLKPKELALLGLQVSPWTALDSIAIGVQLARTIPSDDGNELANAAALKRLGAKAFNRLLPLRTKGSYTTVPASEGRFPSQPGRTRADERKGFRKSTKFVRSLKLPAKGAKASSSAFEATNAALGGAALPPVRGGSNAWAVREPGGKAILFNGPQLGFSIPEQLYEFEIHAPGLNASGVTPPGLPIVGIGRNENVAWGLTSGLTDDDDLYAEKLVGRTRYRYKGKVRKMNCRNETFKVSGGKPRTVKICRTVHGPVQARGKGVAYARRYAIWGRELGVMIGLARLDQATTMADVTKAASEVTWNENMMVATDKGEIAWWHPGLLPLRPKQWDERLPYPGTGKAEWRGFLSPKQVPQVINPSRGWLANWNTLPSAGWTNGDGAATERLGGRLHRSGLLFEQVAKAAANPSFASVQAVDRVTGTTAQARPLLTAALQRASNGASGGAKTVLSTLLAWNGDYATTDPAGTVDPGVAAWRALRDAANAALDKQYGLGTASWMGNKPGGSHAFDLSYAQAYELERVNAKGLRSLAAAAAKALTKRFGTSDATKWREKRDMYDVGVQGLADKPALPFFDRGTWQQEVELGS